MISVLAVVLVLLPSVVVADCPVLKPPFLDVSDRPPASPATPCYKDVQQLAWGGHRLLVINSGRGWLLYSDTSNPQPRGGADLYCHISKPCPGSIPGDYDCPVRRIATCDDCEYVITNGAAGSGGTVITKLRSSGGTPYAGTSWLVPHSTEGGAATYSVAGVQYVATSRWWLQGCGTLVYPKPALWRIDGTTPPPAGATMEVQGYRSSDVLYLTRIACLELQTAKSVEMLRGVEGASDIVMGGLRVDDVLYIASGTAAVSIWQIDGESLVPLGPAPFGGYFYDGIRLIYDDERQLLATGKPSPQLWDVADPAHPELVAMPAGGAVVAFGRSDGRLYLWTADLAGSSALLWDVTRSSTPSPAGGDVWAPSYPWQLWMGGSTCGQRLCVAGGSIAQSVDLSCLVPAVIFADGFESGDTSAWSSSVKALCLAGGPGATAAGYNGRKISCESGFACCDRQRCECKSTGGKHGSGRSTTRGN
jgi:hypothetical protein